MIPKILHYGWFGGWSPSDLNLRCFESWKRVLPDYQWMLYHDSSIPSKWFREAVKHSPINAHNYMLIWSLWKHGGVAMDNDVEAIRPFDLDHGLFVGFQKDDELTDCVNNCVIGAVAGHPVLRRILDRMELRNPTDDPVWLGPGLLTAEMFNLGMRIPGHEQKIGDVMIYAKDRFNPFNHDERHDWMKVTGRAYAVHHFQGSWAKKT